MNYHITENDERIASFVNEHDRDVCLDAFEVVYPDCVFIAVDK